jgi:heme/copper-type cytochrome/quinol oxidase subunit 3
MRPARLVGDVRQLPENVFGAAALTWWAVALLMLIEGTTLALVAASYLYIRQNFHEWPPAHTPLPSLANPTLALVIMFATVVPAWWAKKSANRHDVGGILLGLSLQAVLGVVLMVLRYFECRSLNVHWDTNAYGSVAWGVLVTHAVVMVTDVIDTIGLTLMFAIEEPEEKHFIDTGENTLFWYFVVASWIPLYVLVFLYPRWG